ncbi:MAG: TlpA family protein disulfide reductase [Rubrivivax sp.]|nr:TlpA family protein disulfide reductase [Rubrivivax sp.]
MKLSRPAVAVLAAVILAVIGALAWTSLTRLEPAPAVTYQLLDGSRVTTDDLRGKVVLVNFWATSCVTCVKEMPDIAATHEKFRDRGFETIAVAMSYDPPAFVSRFAETRQLPFAVAIDNTGEIARGFGDVRLTPTTFLINKRGEIVKRYVGEPDFAALHVLVDRLLAAS